jgi:hypothetical protein
VAISIPLKCLIVELVTRSGSDFTMLYKHFETFKMLTLHMPFIEALVEHGIIEWTMIDSVVEESQVDRISLANLMRIPMDALVRLSDLVILKDETHRIHVVM